MSFVVLAIAACSTLGTVACFPLDEGTSPPLENVYFPTGLALSSGGTRLYVVNSNFDLQFNAGTLQALDAEAIVEHLPTACLTDADCEGSLHCHNEEDEDGPPTFLCTDAEGSFCGELDRVGVVERVVAPALCGPLELSRVLLEAVRIAPFATDLRYVPFTDEDGERHARLLMPTRGDATLHWADVEDDERGTGPVLDCGQGRSESCDDDHRRGDVAEEGQLEGEKVPTEPFSIAVSPDGRGVVVAHQLLGMLSLFENTDDGPELQSLLSGLPRNPMGLAAVPAPLLDEAQPIEGYHPGFLVTFRHPAISAPTLELIRHVGEQAAAPGRPFLHRAASTTISTSSSGVDSRGVAVDDARRASCEASCVAEECGGTPGDSGPCVACLTECAKIPLRVYVANRSPDALLSGHTGSTHGKPFRDDLPNLSDSEPLRGGPSRVFVEDIIDEAGNPARRVFVVAFDARLLYIYDPETRTVETHVTTGRGPHAFAVDSARGLGYLAHFTDSYIGVLDLDKRHSTYGEFLLSVGRPTPPRSAR